VGRLLGRGGGAAGFTLLEVLIGLAVLALITVAVTAISLTGVVGIRDGAVERQLDATTAQWVSMRFARDVAGAEKVVTSDCAPPTGSDRLVTLASSTGGFVTYHSRQVSASPATYDLSRQDCSGSVTDRRIVDGLEGVAPSVTCDGGPCVDGDSPRIVRLQVTRTHRFDFELAAPAARPAATSRMAPSRRRPSCRSAAAPRSRWAATASSSSTATRTSTARAPARSPSTCTAERVNR